MGSGGTSIDPLDNPVWHSVSGHHRQLGNVMMIGSAGAGCYDADISPFGGLSDPKDPVSWTALGEILGDRSVALILDPERVPRGWEIVRVIPGVQLEGTDVLAASDASMVELDVVDVHDMLALVEQTRPGPFLPRTIAMGTYFGYRKEGRLLAMAGQRLHPQGWREISAVCTHPGYRSRGLASRLVQAVTATILRQDERPFLHASAVNESAIRLYLSLGFSRRCDVSFTVVRRNAFRIRAQ